MSDHFVKVWADITTSTVWEADPVVRVVWLSLLLECDRYGNFRGTREALARRANVTLEEFNRALEFLMSPDPNSTSPAEGGRRVISTGNNLWSAVNYQQYRERRDDDEEREKARNWKRAQRARKAEEQAASPVVSSDCPVVSSDVQNCPDIVDVDVEVEVEVEEGRKRQRSFTPPTVEQVAAYCQEKGYTFDPEAFVAFYTSKGWKVGRDTMKDWRAACVTWQKRQPTPSTPAAATKSVAERAAEWAKKEAQRGQ